MNKYQDITKRTLRISPSVRVLTQQLCACASYMVGEIKRATDVSRELAFLCQKTASIIPPPDKKRLEEFIRAEGKRIRKGKLMTSKEITKRLKTR